MKSKGYDFMLIFKRFFFWEILVLSDLSKLTNILIVFFGILLALAFAKFLIKTKPSETLAIFGLLWFIVHVATYFLTKPDLILSRSTMGYIAGYGVFSLMSAFSTFFYIGLLIYYALGKIHDKNQEF